MPPTTDAAPTDAKPSVIQVSSNRRALVYLDGRPVGYTPQTISKGKGAYKVGVMLPGRKDTLKEKTVRIVGDGSAIPVTVNF